MIVPTFLAFLIDHTKKRFKHVTLLHTHIHTICVHSHKYKAQFALHGLYIRHTVLTQLTYRITSIASFKMPNLLLLKVKISNMLFGNFFHIFVIIIFVNDFSIKITKLCFWKHVLIKYKQVSCKMKGDFFIISTSTKHLV